MEEDKAKKRREEDEHTRQLRELEREFSPEKRSPPKKAAPQPSGPVRRPPPKGDIPATSQLASEMSQDALGGLKTRLNTM